MRPSSRAPAPAAAAPPQVRPRAPSTGAASRAAGNNRRATIGHPARVTAPPPHPVAAPPSAIAAPLPSIPPPISPNRLTGAPAALAAIKALENFASDIARSHAAAVARSAENLCASRARASADAAAAAEAAYEREHALAAAAAAAGAHAEELGRRLGAAEALLGGENSAESLVRGRAALAEARAVSAKCAAQEAQAREWKSGACARRREVVIARALTRAPPPFTFLTNFYSPPISCCDSGRGALRVASPDGPVRPRDGSRPRGSRTARSHCRCCRARD